VYTDAAALVVFTFAVAVVDVNVVLLASSLLFVPAVVVEFDSELPWLGPMLAFAMGHVGRLS